MQDFEFCEFTSFIPSLIFTSSLFPIFFIPGWEIDSYGYHARDGRSFLASGLGESYGPTFTTGDIVGCGLNLIDSTCFFTSNGVYLGIAFRDLIVSFYHVFHSYKIYFKHFNTLHFAHLLWILK